MFARKAVFSSIGRATVMATVAAMALAVVEPAVARAGSVSPASGATDFSSRARVYHRGGGGAAAAAAFAGIVGTGLAIAAAQNRHAYYDDYDGYSGGPAYYGGGPVYVDPGYSGGYGYYGGGPAYFNGHRDYYQDYRYR
jgi:hypothetical protein